MVVLVALGVMALALIFVLYPLFREKDEEPEEEGKDDLRALMDRRKAAYEDIRDLDADYRLGNLDEEDYHHLREQYTLRAAAILKALDNLRRGDDELEEEIERELQALRLSSSNTDPALDRSSNVQRGQKKISHRSSKSQGQDERKCLSCGYPLEPEDRFCSKCGERQAVV